MICYTHVRAYAKMNAKQKNNPNHINGIQNNEPKGTCRRIRNFC